MKKTDIHIETIAAVKHTRSLLILKLILPIILRGISLIIPIVWSLAIDNVNTDGVYKLIAVTMFITVLYYVFDWFNNIIYFRAHNKLYTYFTNLAAKATVKNSLHSLSRFSLGEYTNIYNNDIESISIYITALPYRIIKILEFIVIFIYFYFINIYIFLATVIVSMLMLSILFITIKKIQQDNLERKEKLDNKTAIIHEFFGNIREVKGFNIFDVFKTRLEKDNKRFLKSYYSFNTYAYKVKTSVLTLLQITRYMIMFYGFYLISIGSISLGTIINIYSYFCNLNESFSWKY